MPSNSQKTLVILASAREQGDTKNALNSVMQGREHNVLDLLQFSIAPYNYDGVYPGTDRFQEVVDELLCHTQIIFATPVYWYAMSGLMKTLFDRFTDLVTIHKSKGRQLKGKEVYMLAVGANEELPDGFEVPFQRSAEYLDMAYKGKVYIPKNQLNTEQTMNTLRQDFLTLLG